MDILILSDTYIQINLTPIVGGVTEPEQDLEMYDGELIIL
jgi:hypothetical protein